MQARMTQPAFLLPDAMKAMMALSKSAHVEGVPETLHELLHLRVSFSLFLEHAECFNRLAGVHRLTVGVSADAAGDTARHLVDE